MMFKCVKLEKYFSIYSKYTQNLNKIQKARRLLLWTEMRKVLTLSGNVVSSYPLIPDLSSSQCFYTVLVSRSCSMADVLKGPQSICLERQILNALNYYSLCMDYCVVSINLSTDKLTWSWTFKNGYVYIILHSIDLWFFFYTK